MKRLARSCAPRVGNGVRSRAFQCNEASRSSAHYFEHVRDEVSYRLRPTKTHADINQHRHDTDEGAMQHEALSWQPIGRARTQRSTKPAVRCIEGFPVQPAAPAV